MEALGEIPGTLVLADEDVGLLRDTPTHTVTDENDASLCPAYRRVVTELAQKRLSEVLDIEWAVAWRGPVPVRLVAKRVDAHRAGEVLIIRQPSLRPVVGVVGREGPCFAAASAEAVDEDEVDDQLRRI